MNYIILTMIKYLFTFIPYLTPFELYFSNKNKLIFFSLDKSIFTPKFIKISLVFYALKRHKQTKKKLEFTFILFLILHLRVLRA